MGTSCYAACTASRYQGLKRQGHSTIHLTMNIPYSYFELLQNMQQFEIALTSNNIIINSIYKLNNICYLHIIKHTKQALVVDISKWWFKQHLLETHQTTNQYSVYLNHKVRIHQQHLRQLPHYQEFALMRSFFLRWCVFYQLK